MATYYITSTANTGTGTLRALVSRGSWNTVQPDPTLFPTGTSCNVSLTANFAITSNVAIRGGQTRLVITSSSYLEHGTSSSRITNVSYEDVDFRGFTSTEDGAIRVAYCSTVSFSRCSFCGISGYTAPLRASYESTPPTVIFKDCAFYGNRATRNSGGMGAISLS